MKKQLEKKLNFHLSPELEKELRKFADEKDWKISFIIREAIKHYLEKGKIK